MTDQQTLQQTLTQAFYQAGSAVSGGLPATDHQQALLSSINNKLDTVLDKTVPSPSVQRRLNTQAALDRATAVPSRLPAIRQSMGMDVNTGKAMTGLSHLKQSIIEIVLTLVGSRVMNREFGSRWRVYQDYPGTNAWLLKTIAAMADALKRWEPRIELVHIQLLPASDLQQGQFLFELSWRLTERYHWLVPGYQGRSAKDRLYTLEVAA